MIKKILLILIVQNSFLTIYCKSNFYLLMKAIKNNNLEVVKELIGKDINIDETDYNDKTPLIAAILQPDTKNYSKNLEIIKLLLMCGATIDPRWDLLICATRIKKYEAIKLLLEYDVEIYKRDASGRTAYEFAMEMFRSNGNYIYRKIAKLLIEHEEKLKAIKLMINLAYQQKILNVCRDEKNIIIKYILRE